MHTACCSFTQVGCIRCRGEKKVSECQDGSSWSWETRTHTGQAGLQPAKSHLYILTCWDCRLGPPPMTFVMVKIHHRVSWVQGTHSTNSVVAPSPSSQGILRPWVPQLHPYWSEISLPFSLPLTWDLKTLKLVIMLMTEENIRGWSLQVLTMKSVPLHRGKSVVNLSCQRLLLEIQNFICFYNSCVPVVPLLFMLTLSL